MIFFWMKRRVTLEKDASYGSIHFSKPSKPAVHVSSFSSHRAPPAPPADGSEAHCLKCNAVLRVREDLHGQLPEAPATTASVRRKPGEAGGVLVVSWNAGVRWGEDGEGGGRKKRVIVLPGLFGFSN